MKSKKILAIFGNVAFYGQERANIQVFELLKDSGYELLLAVNDRGFHWHLHPEVEKRGLAYVKMRFSWNLRKTFRFKVIKAYLIDIPKSNYQLYQQIKRFQPDYIHVCNDTHVMTLLPVLMRNKTKLIYRLGDKPSVHLSSVHKWLWQHFIITRVDQFVCISKFVASELSKLKCPNSKMSIIYNYPPKRLQDTSDENLPERDNSVVTFTFIGQLTKDKGVDILIEAFIRHAEQYPKCRLLIAGSLTHNAQFTHQLIQKVNASGLAVKIIFLNQVKQIEKLLAIADINIIPSVYEEPLSNVIVEAKANEKASIVFASGGLPELVTHKVDGYICSNKMPESLLEGMAYYCNNKALIDKHGQAAFESMDKLQISYTHFKQKWLQVYE